MTRTTAVLLAACALATWPACRGAPRAVFTDLTEARRLAADLRVQLNKAAAATDRAVMADTDEISKAFANEAQQQRAWVRTDVEALEPRLQRVGEPQHLKELAEFKARFGEYEKVDREILALAVENTNLKAQRLSFGPVREAADAFARSLTELANAAPARERCRVDPLVARAVVAVREIEVLHAPHIAERADDVMTRLEGDMAARDAEARAALTALGHLGGKTETAAAAATTAFYRFEELSKQLVALSRRNSNVRSLELVLRRKPGVTGACDGSLHALQEALAKDPYPATR